MLVTQSCPTLCDSTDCSPPGSFCPWNSLSKNTGVGCHFLLQGIFLTQGSNPCLLCFLHWQVGSLPPEPPRKPWPSVNVHDNKLILESCITFLVRSFSWKELYLLKATLLGNQENLSIPSNLFCCVHTVYLKG